MSVTIKSAREIELMRESCKIIAKVHQDLGKELKAGMSTLGGRQDSGRDDQKLWMRTEF